MCSAPSKALACRKWRQDLVIGGGMMVERLCTLSAKRQYQKRIGDKHGNMDGKDTQGSSRFPMEL